MDNPQTVALWVVHAGWTGTDAVTATSVALAGSGASSPAGLFGLGTNGDGNAQAQSAYQAWSARGWGIFTNYSNGRWRLFVPIATPVTAAAEVAASPVVQKPVTAVEQTYSGAKQTVSTLTDLETKARDALSFLSTPASYQRIVKVGAGVGLVWIMAALLAKKVTFDQGVRALKFARDNVGDIMFGRSVAAGGTRSAEAAAAKAPKPKPAAPAAESATANRRPRSGQAATAASTHTSPGRHEAPPPRAKTVEQASYDQQHDKRWSNEKTEAQRVVATAKRPPNPLPGVQSGAVPGAKRERTKS